MYWCVVSTVLGGLHWLMSTDFNFEHLPGWFALVGLVSITIKGSNLVCVCEGVGGGGGAAPK